MIAFNVGGIPDIVVPGKSGALVPPFDIEAMAAQIRKFLHAGGASGLTASSRQLAEERFSAERQVKQLLDEVYPARTAVG